jgi:hypothetical protein
VHSKSEPRVPMVNGQHSGYRHSRCQRPDFLNSESRGADSPRLRHLYSTNLRGPTLPRRLGTSRIAIHDANFPCCQKPRTPTPWDLVPPVPALIDGPVESGNRYSRFQRVNSYLAKRRTPICDGCFFVCELTSP